MSHDSGLPKLSHSEYAPNAQGTKASRSFQMEAQMALNQIVFDADQRRSRYIGVSNMHEVSEHAEEAQRLAQLLLHRMSGGNSAPDAPAHQLRLPPLRSAALKYGAAARPSLAAAKKYALHPSPLRSPQRSPHQSPLRVSTRDTSSPHRQQLTSAPDQRALAREPRSLPNQHQTQLAHAVQPLPHQSAHQSQSPLSGQAQQTQQPLPSKIEKATTASTTAHLPVLRQPPLQSSPHHAVKSKPQTQRQPARSLRSVRSVAPLEPPSTLHRSHSKAPHAEAQHTQVDFHRRTVETPLTSQLAETESVERSILITVWELERSKLLVRINKAIVSYFSWLLEELEDEVVAAMELIHAEEEHQWTSTIWNKIVIKNSAHRMTRMDDLVRQESERRGKISDEESLSVVDIPSRAGHDKYVFFETEYRVYRELLDAESARRTIITTKFKLLEAIVDESNLRKWIETLEDEMFTQNIIVALTSLLQVSEGTATINRREARERAAIVADYENETLYFDRYSTNLSSLCGDTKFWNEKRDIEYHENLRRLFSAASEEQERQEMLKAFFSFMMAKGAVLSKQALSVVLDNEWIRRGLLGTTEQRERSTMEIAFLNVVHDAENELRARRREDAGVAVAAYDRRPQSGEELGHHESTRRGFLRIQEQRERVGLASLFSSLEGSWTDPTGSDAGPSEAFNDNIASHVEHEANRRNFVVFAEIRERRSYEKLFASDKVYMSREEELTLSKSEQVRRTFTARDEHAKWLIIRELITADLFDTLEREQSHLVDNESLRRMILLSSEGQLFRQIEAVQAIQADSDDEEGPQAMSSSIIAEGRDLIRLRSNEDALRRGDSPDDVPAVSIDDVINDALRREHDVIRLLQTREDALDSTHAAAPEFESRTNALRDETTEVGRLDHMLKNKQPSPPDGGGACLEASKRDGMAATITMSDVHIDNLKHEAQVLSELNSREELLAVQGTSQGDRVSEEVESRLHSESQDLMHLNERERQLQLNFYRTDLLLEAYQLGSLKISSEEVVARRDIVPC